MSGEEVFHLDSYVPPERATLPISDVDMPDFYLVALDELKSSFPSAPFGYQESTNGLHSTAYIFQEPYIPHDSVDISTPSEEAFLAMIVAPDPVDLPNGTFPGHVEKTDGISTVSYNVQHVAVPTDRHVFATSSERTIPEIIVAPDPVDLPDDTLESFDDTLSRAFTGEEVLVEFADELVDDVYELAEDDVERFEVHGTTASVRKKPYKARRKPLRKIMNAFIQLRLKARRQEKQRQKNEEKERVERERTPRFSTNSGVRLPPQEKPYAQAKNVQESILKNGHDDFYPIQNDREEPTRALPGTEEKVEVLADRLRRGVPLWHPRDAVDYHYGNNEDDRPNILDFLRGRR